MRYVIVSVVNGKAGEFNNNLRRELFSKFKAKSSKLPAHFTIKAPFEYDGSIIELENAVDNFCKEERRAPFLMDKYNHFDNRVIYMDINMSDEAKKLHDRLIDVLDQFSYIEFTKKDGKDKTFHVTLASKNLQPIYSHVWNYVNNYPFKFDCYFDNVSIYKWEDCTWKLYRKFEMLK
jgi:2'-5' RNA ligase